MSLQKTVIRVCDGCGTTIDIDRPISLRPEGRTVLQRDKTLPATRDFCCESCAEWWKAEYPEHEPWGPAWSEREWWARHTLSRKHVLIHTTHSEMPLVDPRSHFDDPEPIV
jgi:hypothetical protein